MSHEPQCRHRWWETPLAYAGGLVVYALVLGLAAAITGLCVGVLVRAYSYAAGEP